MATAHPILAFGGRRIAVDLPHLAFATAIAGWAAWFCRNAWHASADVENLILILPASVAALVLYLFVAAGCFTVVEDAAIPPRPPLAAGVGLKVAGSMALLAGLVVAGPMIGFDVACFVYILAMLAFLGERRPLVLLLVPLLFCAAAIYGFSRILATPLPLFFFHEAA
jgi:hypothetical protein